MRARQKWAIVPFMSEQTSFNAALTRILRPLIRMAIAHSVGFPAFAALVKQGYLQVAERLLYP